MSNAERELRPQREVEEGGGEVTEGVVEVRAEGGEGGREVREGVVEEGFEHKYGERGREVVDRLVEGVA